MYTILVILTLLLFWFACGFISACGFFAYFQREYPFARRSMFRVDQRVACVILLYGTIGLIVFVAMCRGFTHGFLNPWGKKAKQEAGLI